MKKLILLYILTIFSFVVGMIGVSYADNLSDQQFNDYQQQQLLRHYQGEGYNFEHVGDGWHSLKPMETVCGEIIKQGTNNLNTRLTYKINGVFRLEWAVRQTQYINYKKRDGYIAYSGNWIRSNPLILGNSDSINNDNNEVKLCVQNVSRISKISVFFFIVN